MKQNSTQKGFTLIELIIAIALMAILMAIATPSFNVWRKQSNLKAEAQEVFGAFQRARSEAVSRNKDIDLTFNNGSGDSGTWRISENGTTLSSGSMIAGVQVSSANFGGNGETGFTGRGLPIDSGSVEIKNDERTYTITLSAAGSVKME